MSAVIVDWLGRGGIAQDTRSWSSALSDAGHAVTVVTRGGRELTGPDVLSPAEGPHPLVTHARLARLAARTVLERTPDLVVVQNYVAPPLERSLDRALERSSARRIAVVHDHRLHSPLAGTRRGLRRRLTVADTVVTYSRFVGDAVAAFTGRHDVTVLPLAVPPLGEGGRALLPASDALTALNFGVVKRRYKGTELVRDLAARGVPGWRFAVTGVGAPTEDPRVASVPGFVDGPDLAATVASAAAALTPYRIASQSAAVLLAQHCGTVPIATAVGGLPEQIDHDIDGLLLPGGATLDDWAAALDHVATHRVRLSTGARRRAAASDRAFRERIGALV